MKKTVTALLFVTVAATLPAVVNGQIVDEQHYLVYDMPDPATFTENITLTDQFGEFDAFEFVLTHFANPVDKTTPDGVVAGPILDPEAHQTWWEIFNPQPDRERLVGIDNQFGLQELIVRDGRYLVLPALKDRSDLPLPHRNHYECYDAEGPPVNLAFHLDDQFGLFDVQVLEPALFCNPVSKQRSGAFYEIVDPEAHLTCYELDPLYTVDTGHNAFDQFGAWNVRPTQTRWLCVPTFKRTVVSTESRSWGGIKALYQD